MEIFGEKLKKLRENARLSQEELAKELFVSRSAVAKWEQGRGFPNIESLQLVSKRFKVTIDELVDDKELKILEINANKKLSARKIILIISSVLFAVIVAVTVTLIALFVPRKIGFYVNADVVNVDFINIEFSEISFDADGVRHEEIITLSLNKEYYNEFLDKLKNITISPMRSPCKCIEDFKIIISCDNTSFILSNTQLAVGKGAPLYYGKPVYFHSPELSQLIEDYTACL